MNPLQVDLLNSGITPLVPRWGSVGASGDLIPSSYIARALTGRGAVRFRGGELPAAAALAAAGVPPLALHAKEGLGEFFCKGAGNAQQLGNGRRAVGSDAS